MNPKQNDTRSLCKAQNCATCWERFVIEHSLLEFRTFIPAGCLTGMPFSTSHLHMDGYIRIVDFLGIAMGVGWGVGWCCGGNWEGRQTDLPTKFGVSTPYCFKANPRRRIGCIACRAGFLNAQGAVRYFKSNCFNFIDWLVGNKM